MKKILIVLLMGISTLSFSQKEDNIWLFGENISDIINEEARNDTTWGGTNIDFNFDPPKIYYVHDRILDFSGTNASICDQNGDLLIYSNGQAVMNGNHVYIEDTINFNPQWEAWIIDYSYNGVDTLIRAGLPSMQGALILPYPENDSLYYIFYSEYDRMINHQSKMQYSIIDIINPDGIGSVIERDIILLADTMSSGVNAVKHANGRDWWLISISDSNDLFYKFLITPEGIDSLGQQSIGNPYKYGLGQMYFSPNGEHLAVACVSEFSETGVNFVLMDFDRCTGLLSNRMSDTLYNDSFSAGTSFSYDSKFLYTCNSNNIYQFDLEAEDIKASKTLVAEYDGYKYYYTPTSTSGWSTRFSWMGLAPDGKIYISSASGGNRKMHIINTPNKYGLDCNVGQHTVHLNTSYARTMPNFPNYRLGPLDGSSCDTLGLDNHPIAKYRYDQDTTDDLHIYFHDLSYFDPVDYHWDFGDGETSDELEPDHSYESTGVYEVCLTVSNDYDTDKFCKTLLLGPDAVNDEEHIVDISLFPNPVHDDMNLSFHNYLPLDAELRLYDVSGHEVGSYELHGGMNSLSLRGIGAGVYFYSVVDGGIVVGSGEVVKIK